MLKQAYLITFKAEHYKNTPGYDRTCRQKMIFNTLPDNPTKAVKEQFDLNNDYTVTQLDVEKVFIANE
jgi:hypothetical protein